MAGKYVARVLSSSTTTLLRKTPSFLRPIAALPNTGISPTAVMVRGLSSSEFKLGGLDFGSDGKHWLIWVKEPQGNPTREEIIDSYVNILAHVLGSEEEARMKIYSVSTRHYYAIGALIDEEICSKLRELPQVLSVNEDTYMDMKKKDYGVRLFKEIDPKNVSTECDNLLRLFNKEINLCSSNQGRKGLEGEKEVIKAYGAAQEENSKDAESDVGDNVSSALLNRANGMLQKLEKETEGVGAKISYRWRVLERYCDGKVSIDMVAAATFLKNTLDKEGIQELISHLAKYKEEIEKLGTGAEDIEQGQNELVHKSEETVTLGVEAEDINQRQNQPGGSGTPLDY